MPPLPNPIPVSGVRRCWGCNTLYAAAAAAPTPERCPACGSEHTVVIEPSPGPRQQVLFTVPPAPRPNTWIVEWRWKPCGKVRSRWQRPPSDYCDSGINPWTRLSNYNITRKTTGIQIAARHRKNNPWKSFRLRPVSWESTPLLP